MLVGEKGSGKTLLARQISIQSEYPTVIVNSSFSGEQFNSFLSGITQPCIILFDEFEKTYKKDEQEKILTLLDGTFQSQKLFIFTSNNKWELDNNLKNRPGRIFYLIEFSGLDEEFIREYCKDNLVDQGKIGAIVATSGLFDVFNFDMLVAFVQEVNRYGEDPSDLIDLLNAKPEYSGRQSYLVRNLEVAGVSIPISKHTVEINTSVNPFNIPVYFYWSEEEVVKQGVKTQIENIFYNDEVDFNLIAEYVKSGLLIPGNPPPAPEGNTGIQHSYIHVKFFPEDIVKYLGANSILYSSDDGCKAELVKHVKSKKRGLP
jgi:hypothetical protein